MKVSQKGRSTTPVLIIILLFSVYIVWSEGIYTKKGETDSPSIFKENKSSIDKDEIVSVELIDINYWEAKFNVNYKHRSDRKAGYLTVTGESWSPNVGLNTKTGAGSGITYLSRKYARDSSHFDTYIEARMYDPYRNDHSFAKEKFPTDLIWPGENGLPKVDAALRNRFLRLGEVVIYRNIPNYIQFAEKLTASGFPPHKMTMMLAVCPNCEGSLIYGNNVNFDELQVLLIQLQQHGVSLATVYHSTEAKHAGKIYIGDTPPPNSKPLWVNIDRLVAQDIQRIEFFNVMGFPQKEDWEIAIDKTEKAKRYINGTSKKNYKYARSLLDQAIKLDSSYIPAYLESARLIMRAARFNEEYPSENAKKAVRAAKNVIKAALKIDPHYADAYVLLGYTETVLKNYNLAASSFDKAKGLGTNNLWLLYNRAFMFKGLKQESLVINEYEKVIGINPDGGDNDRPLKRILNKLAGAYWVGGESEKSITTYRQLHTFFPGYYSGNIAYLKVAIANGSDQANVAKIIVEYKRKNWKIAYYADAMITLIDAADKISSDKAYAITAVASAQASHNEFVNVVADLSKGKAGRKAIEKLFNDGLLNINSLEEPSSLLLLLMGSKDIKPLEFALKMGANPNYVDTGYYSSPLIQAVMTANYTEVKLLLAFGADPLLKASNGYSAIDWAEKYGKSELIEMLSTKALI